MSASTARDLRAEPNLTPILDMVFQLITFFMLVINFKTASIDTSLRLPVVGSARPVDMGGEDLLVLNIDNQGRLRVYGTPVQDIPGYIGNEAQAKRLAARRSRLRLPSAAELDSLVVIRADRTTPFKLLNRVIVCCQENGFRKFSFKALDREGQG